MKHGAAKTVPSLLLVTRTPSSVLGFLEEAFGRLPVCWSLTFRSQRDLRDAPPPTANWLCAQHTHCFSFCKGGGKAIFLERSGWGVVKGQSVPVVFKPDCTCKTPEELSGCPSPTLRPIKTEWGVGTSTGILEVAPGDSIVKLGLGKDGCARKCHHGADSELVIKNTG